MTDMNRRGFLSGMGSVVIGGVVLSACGGGGDSGESSPGDVKGSGSTAGPVSMQLTWWGNPERDKRTAEAVAAFRNKHPGATVRTQFSGWDGYWERLATQVAGGQPPDVIQMSTLFLAEYAGRDALLQLDEYVPDTLKISDFGENALGGGRIGGKLYGVNGGLNTLALMYDTALLKQVNVEMPDHTMTWDDFARLSEKVKAGGAEGTFGCENALFDIDGPNGPFECWLRQRGKSLYTADGQLAYEPADLVEWFKFWQQLMASGAASSAEVQAAAIGDVQNSLLAKGKAAFKFAASNQLTAFATVAKGAVDIHMAPSGGAGAQPGQYYWPSLLWAVSAKSKNPASAAELVNALVADPDVAGVLGSERGIPASPGIRAAIASKATAEERRVIEYIDFIADKVAAAPSLPPKGAGDVTGFFTDGGEQVAFGKKSPEQAADQFFTDANKALKG